MGSVGCLLGMLVFLQVPPPSPTTTTEVARELEAARRWVLARETAALEGLAEELTRLNQPEAAGQIRNLCPAAALPDGPTRLMPLPEVVGPGGKLRAGGDRLPKLKQQNERRSPARDAPWQAKAETIRSGAASKLFELAQRAPSRTRRGTRWPVCVCARCWSGNPIIPRRGGCWAMSGMGRAGPGLLPSGSSRTAR